MTTTPDVPPILVIADIHGNLDLFERVLTRGRERAGRDDVTVVTLGDYCDNGPRIRDLIERLATFAESHPGEFLPILGNHDLACLRALGDPDGGGDQRWWERWGCRYPNGTAVWTPTQYGADTLEEFRAQIPPSHWLFLRELPWARRVGGYVFVHSGLERGAVEPQLAVLADRDLRPYEGDQWSHLPPPIRDKNLSTVADPTWSAVIVSGHNRHLPGDRDFLGPNRLTLWSGACAGGPLHAALLPAVPRLGAEPVVIEFFSEPDDIGV